MSEYTGLHAAYQTGQVCLVIGAGVSMGCGLPGWKDLAEKIIDSFPRNKGPVLGSISAAIAQGRPIPLDPNALLTLKQEHLGVMNPLLSMRYARRDPDIDLESLVAKRLYGSPITLSDTVLEIVALEKVRRICCFNYDDILVHAFAENKRPYQAVFQNDRIPLESQETLIFYPHGFLPHPDRQLHKATQRIVLSEDDYHELYGTPYAWSNIVQLILLLSYTALFIGCSLLDPNLRRLLDIAASMRTEHNHYAFVHDPFYRQDAPWYQKEYSQAYRAVQSSLLSGLKVLPIWVSEWPEIAQKLQEMRVAET